MDLPLTLPNVILTLKEFIIVWINQVLYYNAIYPKEIYDKVKSFATIVYQSRNPVLNKYIEDLVNEFLQIVIKGDGNDNGGKVDQILIIIYDLKSNRTKKKYGMKFNEVINFSSAIDDLEFLNSDNTDSENLLKPVIDIPNFTWEEIYSQLKSILSSQIEELKIVHANNSPFDDLFFKIMVDVEDSLNLDMAASKSETSSQYSNWVRIPPKSGIQEKTITRKLIPVGEMSIGFIYMDLYNEYYQKN